MKPLLSIPPGRLSFLICPLLMCVLAPAVRSQIPYLDPLPWFALEDSASGFSVLIQADRFDDEKFNWSASRIGLTGILPSGARSILFVRASTMSLDTDEAPALQRWPAMAGEPPPGWPGESRIVGWVRPEFGLIGDIGLPLVKRVKLGLAAALPVGRDELYPLTAASMPIRLSLRKILSLSDTWRLALTAGHVQHLDSGRDFLTPEAFPSGQMAMLGLSWQRDHRRSLELSLRQEDLDGRSSTRMSLQWWFPYRDRHAIGIFAQREFAGAVHRPFATLVSLVWRLQTGAAAEANRE